MTADERRRRQREAIATLRSARAASGTCRECREPRVPGRTRCQRHLDALATAYRASMERVRAAVPPQGPLRPAKPRVGMDPVRRLYAEARAKIIGRRHPTEVALRQVSALYERRLLEAGLLLSPANVPPPGWTVEEDRREEFAALSWDSALRRVS